MEKEPTTDRPDGNVPIDDLVKDQKSADPAHPLPKANGPDSAAEKVTTDAEIEDRFEATDN